MTNIVHTTITATLTIFALLQGAVPALAHEFWIDLERGRVQQGDPIVGDLKVGQMLKGDSYPYLSNRFRRFTVTNGEHTLAVKANEGDMPALSHVARRSGLHVIAHHTTDFRVTYDEWDVFLSYLEEEGLKRFAEQHNKRGLPRSGFAERYTRCIKALVSVGPVAPSQDDVNVGMPLELVAQTNPYAPGSDTLAVTLYWRNQPLPNWQISIFRKKDTVVRTRMVTDENGQATIQLPGTGDYLLSAVHLQPARDAPVV